MPIELTDKITPKNAAFTDIVDAKNVGGDGTSSNALQADAVASHAALDIVRIDSTNSFLEGIATVPVGSGGTGATTLTGYVKGSGTSALTAAATIPGTDVSGNISGNAANVTGTVAVGNGGTGQTTYTNGQLLIGNTTGGTLARSTITAGSGISVTNGAGSITIAATGGGGSGDVVGPASATDNRVARFDGTTGKLIQNSGVTIDDSGSIFGNGDIFSGTSGAVYGYGGVVAGSTGVTFQSSVSGLVKLLANPTAGTTSYDARLPTYAGSVGQVLRVSSFTAGTPNVIALDWINQGTGDVTGPASATDNALARFDGTTGKLVQNSSATLSDAGALSVGSVSTSTLTATGDISGQGNIYSGTGSTDYVFAYGGLVVGGGTGYLGIQLNDNSSIYNTTIQVPTLSANRTIVLPASAGSSNQFLRTDGAGNTTWATPGTLVQGTYTDSTARQNTASTAEQDASSYTLAGNTLTANGDWVKVRAAFEWAANGDAKNQSVYFAGTKVYDAGTPGTGRNNTKDYVYVTVVRTGTTTASFMGSVNSTIAARSLPVTGTLTGLSFTGSIVIKSTYQSGTATAANITQRLFILDYGKGTV